MVKMRVPPALVHLPTENQEPAKSSNILPPTETIHKLTGVRDTRLTLCIDRIPLLEPVRFRFIVALLRLLDRKDPSYRS